ncbi:uncharacterized protein DMAD_02276 [Drosophila madeirensis]|uniref:Uncharacterized protein n=1 Tax=Drosophila madeirensis TaxID=30013 RepID=A0AAU9G5R6_DROMD
MWQPEENPALPDLSIVDGPLLELLNEDLVWLKDETPPPHRKQMRDGETQTQTQTQTQCSLQVSKSTQTSFYVPKPWQADRGLVALLAATRRQADAKFHQVSKATQVQPMMVRKSALYVVDMLFIFSLAYTLYSALSADPVSWLKETITQLFPNM